MSKPIVSALKPQGVEPEAAKTHAWCACGRTGTQNPVLRKRLNVEEGARRLETFLRASVEMMQVLARAGGHNPLSGFTQDDLATWNRPMAELTGIAFAGDSPQ